MSKISFDQLTTEEKSGTQLNFFSNFTLRESNLRAFMQHHGWYPTDVGDWGEVPHYNKYFEEYTTTVYLIIDPILKRRCDAVIGTRINDKEGMPLIRRVFNRIGNIVTQMLFGVKVTDSQSGFRAFSRKAAKKLDIRTNRMEVSSEIIREIGRKKLKLIEVPIKAIYTDYSMSKGQNFVVGVKTFWKLVLHKIMN